MSAARCLCEFCCTSPPGISLALPVLVPPAIGLEHAQGEDVVDVIGVPPCSRDLHPSLDDVAVAALDLAARRAPALVAVVGVGDGVVVPFEVAILPLC